MPATSSSRSSRPGATIAVQSLLGVGCFVLWVLLALIVFGDALEQVVATAIPCLLSFEAGILSRYFPGLKALARRLQ